MKNVIKENLNKIISMFILMQPILDVVTGICIHIFNINFTLGIIIRVLFLLFIMLCSFFIYNKKKNGIYFLLVGIYSIFYLLGIILYKNEGIFGEMQGLFRTFYFPLLFLSLYSIRENLKLDIKILITTLIMYLLLIFVPTILNMGFKTYEITKSGTLGFFNSANEISGIISILTPMIIICLKDKKPSHKTLVAITLIIYLYIILNIGTKTPLLSLIITVLFSIIWLWIKNIRTKNYKAIGVSFFIVFILTIGIIAIIPKTNFYKNIETHLEFLEVDNVFDVLEKPKLVDHFIFSQRLTFLSKKQKEYKKSNIYQKLFGIGYLKNNKQTKMIEMDYFDIFYSQGIVGSILFFGIYIYLLIKILRKRQKLDFKQYMLYVSLFLIVVLSLFTGHIINAPSVSTIVICLLLLL